MSFAVKARTKFAGIVQAYGLRAWASLLLKAALSLAILELGTRGLLAFKDYLDRSLPTCYDYVTARCRPPYEYFNELIDVVQFDSVTGVSHRPNYRGQWISTNAQGFRGTVDYGEKAPGTLRVVVLGGSAVWGPLVHDDETTPAYLQEELEAQLGRPVEVINSGVTSERSSEELRRLIAYILPLKPDVVVVYDGRNDLFFGNSPKWDVAKTPAVQNHEALVQQQRADSLAALTNQVWETSLHYSKFLSTLNTLSRVIGERLQASAASALAAEPPAPATEVATTTPSSSSVSTGPQVLAYQEAIAAYKTNLRHMAILLKSEDIVPIFALQAILQSGVKPLTPEEEVILQRLTPAIKTTISYYPDLQVFFREFPETEAGVVALDYTRVFADVPDLMYYDDVHYTPQGNKIIAQRLADDIVTALEQKSK
jgi:lysophospholipase L1-like esterase